jgi:nucleoside-diphosphate-sugar epimerase
VALPATIWGDGDESLVAVAERAAARGWLRVGARASLRLCFVHIDDCADGVLRVADRGADGAEYILSAEVVPIHAWLDTLGAPAIWLPEPILDALGRVAARLPGARARLVAELIGMSRGRHWSFSGARARDELGWRPAYSVLRRAESPNDLSKKLNNSRPSPAGSSADKRSKAS